jgi:hypothetical protein
MHCHQWRVLGTYGRCVTKLVFFASKNLSQDTTHNLATSSLGQIRNDEDSLGSRKGTNALSDLENEILSQLVVDLVTILDRNKGVYSLPGELIIDTHHSSFSYGGVLDQCGFDLGSRETVTGNIDDIVDTSSDPVVAFVITSCSVTRELRNVSI